MRRLAAFADGPHHQRLAAPHVAGGEDLGSRGVIVELVGLDVAAGIELDPETRREIDQALADVPQVDD